MQNFKQKGDVVVVTAPEAVDSGEFIKVNSLFGVAQTSAESGELVPLVREGVFELPKATGTAWTQGDQLYWDASAKKFTKTAAGNKPIGVAFEDAESAATTGIVSIDQGPGDANANAVLGASSGYKVARGVASITGTLDIDTGLATVVAAVLTLAEDAGLGGNTTSATIPTQSGGTAGHITGKVWKPTSSSDTTPIAASAAKSVSWIAIGT